jgi:hypothetical protein
MFLRSLIVLFTIFLVNFQWADWNLTETLEDSRHEIHVDSAGFSSLDAVPQKNLPKLKSATLSAVWALQLSLVEIQVFAPRVQDFGNYLLQEFCLLNIPPPLLS